MKPVVKQDREGTGAVRYVPPERVDVLYGSSSCECGIFGLYAAYLTAASATVLAGYSTD